MAHGKSVPAGSGPPNVWEEYSRFHEACAAVLHRVERRGDVDIPLTESERSELGPMALNLAALGRLLHGKRARDVRLLLERLNRVLERGGAAPSAPALDTEEAQPDVETITG